MLWIWLTLAIVALVALRYCADSRDGADRYPFTPRGPTTCRIPSAPAGGYRRAHTPVDDLAVLVRATRAALQRLTTRW